MSKANYYVSPKEFKESLQKFYDSDVLTDDLAENVKKIAYGLSYNSNFINYTYKDDMIGDALIKMYSALSRKKYSFSTESNPFSYFTTIAFNAFINRIKKEKRHHEAEKNYRERLYENLMSDADSGGGYVYVKPILDDDNEYDQDQ